MFLSPPLCDLCIHVSRSEQPRRVSWVLSEASSWAEYEHKWCFHSVLLSAVWILPQAFISMAAAFSLIPGLCDCMCASVRTHRHTHPLSLSLPDLHTPPNYSWILLSTFLFPSWISPAYLLLHIAPLSPRRSLHPCLFLLLIFLWFFLLLFNLPPSPRLVRSNSHALVVSCMMIIPSSSLSPRLLLHTFL